MIRRLGQAFGLGGLSESTSETSHLGGLLDLSNPVAAFTERNVADHRQKAVRRAHKTGAATLLAWGKAHRSALVKCHRWTVARYAAGDDKARLAQLLDNLVSSAIKFSSADGRVLVRLYPEKGHAVLEVADSGMGIPPAEQAHVIERFFSSSNATEQAISGEGLGLSIAQLIVEAHGGSITFASKEGEGTTFRIQLPLARQSSDGRAAQADAA